MVAGLAVADIIGVPVDLNKLPKRGGLQMIDSVTLASGGNVSNVGIDLAKLGARVGAITRIGNDALGRFLKAQYLERGIDTSGVIVDGSKQTSATFVSVGKDGERTFLHTRGCMANFRARDVLHNLSFVKKARLFAFGYLGLLPETERDFKNLFSAIKRDTRCLILLDTAGVPRVSLQSVRAWLPLVDFFIPSLDEATQITRRKRPEEIVDVFRCAGARKVVGVKLGSNGCYVSDGRKARYLKPKRVKKVVDATGAGDAFVAGFIAATLRGFDPFKAAEVGNAVAADCITAIGASTAIKPLKVYVRH